MASENFKISKLALETKRQRPDSVKFAEDLSRRFRCGFRKTNLYQRRNFFQAWPESQIFQMLSGKSEGIGKKGIAF